MLIRIFSRAFEPKDYAMVEIDSYLYDYLTLNATQISVPKVPFDAEQGDYCKLGEYDGIINAVDNSDTGVTVLTVLPLLSMFNISSYWDRTRLYVQTIETFFKEWIASEFLYNEDAVQNITGFEIATTTNTQDCLLNLVDDVNNIYEIAVKALLKYKMVITLALYPQEKRLKCSIGVNDAGADYIKADLANVLEKNISLQNAYGTCNKYTAVDANGLERNMTYYADDYAAPTFPVTELITSGSKEDFKIGTTYQRLYFPLRPKTPTNSMFLDMIFDNYYSVSIGGLTSVFSETPMIYIMLSASLYFVYPFYEFEANGYTFTAGVWHEYDGTSTHLCADGYPSNSVDEEGYPSILIESVLTSATRLDLLGDYVSTRPIEFYERAIERTYELFKPEAYDNLIELTVKKNDSLVKGYKIGSEENIITDGKSIPSILTGYEIVGDTIKWIFGGVRLGLTEKLKIEKRQG